MKLKKFTITRIFTMILAATTFYGCQQEDVLQEQSDLELTNDTKTSFLSFDSKSDYEKIFTDQSLIESMESIQGDFVSLKSTIESFDTEHKNARKAQRLEDTLYADYGILPEILNRDKIVKIGDYLIKVDLHTETVLVLESKYKEQYKDLAESNMTNENIMTFSTDDEVLTLLAQDATGSVNSRMACGDDSAKPDHKREYVSSGGSKYRYKAKMAYQKAGIFFSLISKIKNQKKSWGIWWSDGSGWSCITYSVTYRVRCGANVVQNGFVCENGHKSKYRPYSGTTQLESYRMISTYNSSHGAEITRTITG